MSGTKQREGKSHTVIMSYEPIRETFFPKKALQANKKKLQLSFKNFDELNIKYVYWIQLPNMVPSCPLFHLHVAVLC